jgi:hypothetical protein
LSTNQNQLLKALLRRHPLHKKRAEHWDLLSKLSAGGSEVDLEVKKKLLVSPNCRSQDVINERALIAPYYPLIGIILARLQSHLMGGEVEFSRIDKNAASSEFWDETFFKSGYSSDRGRKSLNQAIGKALLLALSEGLAIAQIDVPNVSPGNNKLAQSKLKGDEPYVLIRRRSDLWDWESDETGLTYAKLHSFRTARDSWKDDLVPVHEFLIYEREGNSTYFSRYLVEPKSDGLSKKADFNITIANDENSRVTTEIEREEIFFSITDNQKASVIPLAILELEPALCLGDQLFDLQKSVFNQTAATEWALLSTNYAQLVFTEVEDEQLLKERIGKTGDGFYWGLPRDVKAGWLERSGHGIELSIQYRNSLKKEMLEVISQVAIAASAINSQIAQSGESKKEDRRNLDILLEVYGQHLSSFVQSILNIAAIARGDNSQWLVSGFTDYDSDTFLEDLEQYAASSPVIDSKVFSQAAREQLLERAIAELGLNPKIREEAVKEMRSAQPESRSTDFDRQSFPTANPS